MSRMPRDGNAPAVIWPPVDVCVAVVSHLPLDARVWKEVRTLARCGLSVRLIGLRYDIEAVVRESCDGIEVVALPFGIRGDPKSKVRGLLSLWREILASPARVYHCHNIHPAPAVWIASRLRGASVVYDAHELYGEQRSEDPFVDRLAARVSFAIERLMVRRSYAVITTNPSRVAVLRRRHGRESIIVLANVPSLVGEVVPLNPGFPSHRRILLYQGGIYPNRSLIEAIEALPLLNELDLVILGFGRDSEIARLREAVRRHHVEDRVHFLGPRPFDELVRTAAAATVGLVPIRPMNLNSYLGDTNKLHEYLMAGLPVVASDIPEIRRVINAGDPPVGEVYDPSSPADLAAAVKRILADPALLDARRREARRLALAELNWEAQEGRLRRLYRNLLENNPAGTPPEPRGARRVLLRLFDRSTSRPRRSDISACSRITSRLAGLARRD